MCFTRDLHLAAWATAALLAATPHARAGAVLDSIRQQGVLQCAGTIRPGLAFPATDGTWHGLEVDICRAVAVGVLGPQARIVFHGDTEAGSSVDPARTGADPLAFLTASEILAQNLLGTVAPGPVIFYRTTGLMVAAGFPVQHAADLAGRSVCAEPGTGTERTLVAWFAAHTIPVRFAPFQEAEEMQDAFYAGRCEAVANDTASLAALRLQAAADGHPARLLPDLLGAVPLLAATPRGDGDWAAIVAWTVHTLLAAASPGGALPLAGPPLGLAPGWQGQVLAAVGTYQDIYRRNLGATSPLDLPEGPNALWTEGGLMCPPLSE